MARVLITGGSSYLGRHLVPVIQTEHEVIYTFLHNDPLQLESGYQLDIRDDTAVTNMVQSWRPDVIIHTAGSNRGEAMGDVIRLGTQHMCNAAQQVAAQLIHFSTDSIFSGNAPPYDETAVPDPVNEYGRAKADAEAIVQTYPHHIIIRTSLIYSLQEMDHGTAWMAEALQAGKPITLFNNQIRNPVWMDTLTAVCVELINHAYRGILNVAGKQTLSRADFSLRMLDWWQIKNRATLEIAPSKKGNWPLNCKLDLDRASTLLNTPLLGVDTVLQQKSLDGAVKPTYPDQF